METGARERRGTTIRRIRR